MPSLPTSLQTYYLCGGNGAAGAAGVTIPAGSGDRLILGFFTASVDVPNPEVSSNGTVQVSASLMYQEGNGSTIGPGNLPSDTGAWVPILSGQIIDFGGGNLTYTGPYYTADSSPNLMAAQSGAGTWGTWIGQGQAVATAGNNTEDLSYIWVFQVTSSWDTTLWIQGTSADRDAAPLFPTPAYGLGIVVLSDQFESSGYAGNQPFGVT